MLTVLKLGGSVITHKDEPETVDWESLEAAVAEIAGVFDGGGELVVVHGAGGFGHHYAATHGVSDTEGSADAAALADIHRSMGELNRVVLGAFHEHGVGALPVRPLSVASRDREGGLRFPDGGVAAMLGEGFVPVVHGDVVVHGGRGGTILSGDEVVVSLARSLGADRVGLCSTVPGVLDGEAVVPEIASYDEVAAILGDSAATDVTGGMAGKVRRLLDLDAPASVFDLDALPEFLATGTAGTVVRGAGRSR